MAGQIEMTAQLAAQTLRSAYYFSVYRLSNLMLGDKIAAPPQVETTRPLPSQGELLGDLFSLLQRDARNVRDGIYPPSLGLPLTAAGELRRLRMMLADMPRAAERRAAKCTREAALLPEAEGLPDYYIQNFHFQDGGYLTENSAELYDLQVETLFLGSADLMRRAMLEPISRAMAGRDQRQMQLCDVACGTGRLLRQVLRIWPALNATGVDLSASYLAEARRHIGSRRSLRLVEGNAEALPVEAASQDVVTTSFLFHELPAPVRRKVAAEFARVLKPGGVLVFLDSLQFGDHPPFDGMLEAFPERFHEPYYRHYAGDDLAGVFEAAGLHITHRDRAFLSKLLVAEKPAAA